MKNIKPFAFALLLSILLTSCGGTTPGDTTESSGKEAAETTSQTENVIKEETAETEESETLLPTVTVEEYTDISSLTSPKIEADGGNGSITKSSPDTDAPSTKISLDGSDPSPALSLLDISGIHNTVECPECGYREINGETAYYICRSPENQGGMALTLKTPFPAKLLTGMTVTYMSSTDITDSQIRILRSDGISNSAFINDCPSMSGAVGDWKTCDLGLTESDMTSLANGGYIRSFKLYFRNKDDTDIYIKSIDFTVSAESLCKAGYITENCFGKEHAVALVAQKIADRFSALGISAEISVKAASYSTNSPKKMGKLTYNATVKYADGSTDSFKALTADILPISNAWLELGDGPYGIERNSKAQYTGFNNGGVITLEDNTFGGADDLRTVQYAVIDKDKDVTDSNIIWYAPQYLKVNGDSFSLFINAFLSYGESLIEGEDYRLVIRGVTEHSCYGLHLDIPFTYQSFDKDIENTLLCAERTVREQTLELDPTENIADKAEAKLVSAINKDDVAVDVSLKLSGVNSVILSACIYSKSAENYSYIGDALTVDIPITFKEQNPDISLLSPTDGELNIAIASSYVIEHMAANYDYLTSSQYPFVREERCTPPATVLEWTGSYDSYTVKLSESDDMQGATLYVTDEERLEITNLKANTTYYWQVEAEDESSLIFCFTTADMPRFIKTDGVSNFRDIGGWQTADGSRIRQGLVYRSAQLEGVTDEDIALITEALGIKTDLDLRGQSTTSPLGAKVNAIPVSIQWYSGIFPKEHNEAVRAAICEFANEANYPMVYHCAIGRDRTGTVTILILGLLGVDEETIIRDYLLSFQAVSGNDGTNSKVMVDQAKGFMKALSNYADEGATFKEQVEGFLFHIGVTEEEMQSIRDILLEE